MIKTRNWLKNREIAFLFFLLCFVPSMASKENPAKELPQNDASKVLGLKEFKEKRTQYILSQKIPPFEMDLPLDCTIGKDCFIQNYVDINQDTGQPYQDYTCGRLTYPQHKGTDIRVLVIEDLVKGVPVKSVAYGVVRAIRNTVDDVFPFNEEQVKGQECGNGVVIDHGWGWQTQYCHLRKGSVLVRVGGEVQKGTPLGLMGMSGKTAFPHVHVSVRFKDVNIDPFIGPISQKAQCGASLKLLWSAKAQKQGIVPYIPTGVLSSGITTEPPKRLDVFRKTPKDNTFSTQIPQFYFWVHLFGVQTGDYEIFQVFNPENEMIIKYRKGPVEGHKAVRISSVGKKLKADKWPPGTYKCSYSLYRKDSKNLKYQEHLKLETEFHLK